MEKAENGLRSVCATWVMRHVRFSFEHTVFDWQNSAPGLAILGAELLISQTVVFDGRNRSIISGVEEALARSATDFILCVKHHRYWCLGCGTTQRVCLIHRRLFLFYHGLIPQPAMGRCTQQRPYRRSLFRFSGHTIHALNRSDQHRLWQQ